MAKSFSYIAAKALVDKKVTAEEMYDVLHSHGLHTLLPQVIKELVHFENKQKEDATLYISSPYPISSELTNKIQAHMKGQVSGSLFHEDKSLLAGFRARLGTTVFDASAKNIINRLLQ